jgi:alpha-L-rhamnosidase
VNDILETHCGHTTVGLIGNQWLLPTLSRLGRADVAHTIATRTDRPSWGYMVGKGATTIWERWDTDTRGPGMNSEALLIQAGSLGAWFVETVAGIAPDPSRPGSVRLLLRPHLAPGLEWARADVQTPHGLARSHWRREGDCWVWEVTVPPGTTALAHVPCESLDNLRESGGWAATAPGVSVVQGEGGLVVLELGAGEYRFNLPGLG